MSEQFSDTSGILGFRPGEEPAEEPLPDDQQQDDANDLESDDPGSSEVDASGDDDNSGDAESEDEGGSDDSVELKAEMESLQKKYDDAEKSRRDWQSKAMSSDSDLSKALDVLKGQNQKADQTTGKSVTPTLDKLESMEPTDVVDAQTVVSVLKEIKGEQTATTQQRQMDDLVGRISRTVSAKNDLKEVATYMQENDLRRDPESDILNDLGNYYRGRSHFLESQLKEARENGRKADVKEAKARKERLGALPSVGGGQVQRETGMRDPSGIIEALMKKRKARGIGKDGSIR